MDDQKVTETEYSVWSRDFFDILGQLPADFLEDGRDDPLPQDRENLIVEEAVQ